MKFLQPKQVLNRCIFYLSSLVNLNIIDWQIERIILKIIAVQNELTLNPSTNLEHNKIITALITNKNNPNVSIVTGNVKSTNIGFTIALSKPKTTATITAVVKFATSTLVIKCAISITNPDVIRILMSSFISY